MTDWFSRIAGIFKKNGEFTLGIYGSPNAGKTTLANRLCMDWMGREAGKVSPIPHETRTANIVEHLEMRYNGKRLRMNVVDMPGISSKIDYKVFLKHGLSTEEAIQRAKEATRGVIEAIQWLDTVDLALTVFDTTKVPFDQVNLVILGNLRAKNIPNIIVANKIDLPKSRPKLVAESFPDHKCVAISALTGENVEELYKLIIESQ
ncbi:MAG: Era-like GTP-binding protein [Candidatus Jordarchaeaceae archaeon]|nr:GTP-binding protein [Candidatus Jordarchaeia archaeon]MBS7269056.1 GTP-binding protein [Candidatus Jordarchaeia archaeon]MBS7279884.1 GTP-binding protein [Candidatus Jordarchaeia archaeon]